MSKETSDVGRGWQRRAGAVEVGEDEWGVDARLVKASEKNSEGRLNGTEIQKKRFWIQLGLPGGGQGSGKSSTREPNK